MAETTVNGCRLGKPEYLLTVMNDQVNALAPGGTGWDDVVELVIQRRVGGLEFPWRCTGTLLPSGRHVLTAAHCFTNGNGELIAYDGVARFHLAGGTQEVPFKLPLVNLKHPNYNGDGGSTPDAFVVPLMTKAPLVSPRRFIWRDAPPLFVESQTAGFGLAGTGLTGQQDGTGGVRRKGANLHEMDWNAIFPSAPAGMAYVMDFDSGLPVNNALERLFPGQGFGNLGVPNNQEVSNAGGDSGGSHFVNSRIAFITSFSQQVITPIGEPRIDANPNKLASFGDLVVNTSVSSIQGWIDSVVPTTIQDVVVASVRPQVPYSFQQNSGSGQQLRSVPIGVDDILNISVRIDDLITVNNLQAAVELRGVSGIYNVTPVLVQPGVLSIPITSGMIQHRDASNRQHRGDKLTLTVRAAQVRTGAGGALLDGDWINPNAVTQPVDPALTRFPSGDGAADGDFSFRIVVLPGDINRDNRVDINDFIILRANLGLTAGATYAVGDVDGDGDVDIFDFVIFQNNFGLDWTQW